VAVGVSSAAEAMRGRRQAWAEVDLDILAANLRALRARVGTGRRLIGIVKADAYGHGALPVARRLEAEGIDLLGVALPEEGLALREAGMGVPILVLGAADPSQIPMMDEARLTPVAYSLPFLEALLAEGARRGRAISFHLKVDTGMGRLGLLPAQLAEALERLDACRDRVALDGMLTHLSCSEDPSDPHTAAQVQRFGAALSMVRAAGWAPRHVHASNSGGLLHAPGGWFDTLRPGLSLYGLDPAGLPADDLRPVLSLRTRVVLVKRLPAGSPVGYGHAWVAPRDSVIGTLAIGYGDGLGRRAFPDGWALVRGRRAPFAGRISMDHCTVDLTAVPGAAEGDEAVLVGRQGDECIRAEDLAAWEGTISYEVLARLGPRLHRVFLRAGRVQEIL
jgi:alanine racemase